MKRTKENETPLREQGQEPGRVERRKAATWMVGVQRAQALCVGSRGCNPLGEVQRRQSLVSVQR